MHRAHVMCISPLLRIRREETQSASLNSSNMMRVECAQSSTGERRHSQPASTPHNMMCVECAQSSRNVYISFVDILHTPTPLQINLRQNIPQHIRDLQVSLSAYRNLVSNWLLEVGAEHAESLLSSIY
ncbi:hypothetical protein J6590_012471 [Homalodisca vitripennis]|nr:hypothetical protein J6590_012471 [Homalodisca vitripennis]